MHKLNRKQKRLLMGRTKRVSSTKLGAGSLNNPAVYRTGKFARPKGIITSLLKNVDKEGKILHIYKVFVKAFSQWIKWGSFKQHDIGQPVSV